VSTYDTYVVVCLVDDRTDELAKQKRNRVGVGAVIYARISEDHERAESVPTQIANASRHAERMGWDVARVFKDEGRSGFTGEVRPGFEDMLKFLGRGDVQVLIARHHDRLTRNAEDFDRLMKICGKSNIKISTYTGGELDLSTASGGFYGFMETARSWYESAIRSQRVQDAHERNARAGKRLAEVQAVRLRDRPARSRGGRHAPVAHRRRGA
jgi:site-specific DNA recombinase